MKIQPEVFSISDYLGKEFECECGHTHHTHLKEVVIRPGAMGQVPLLIRKYGHQKPLIVCDENTYAAAGEGLAACMKEADIPYLLHVIRSRELVPDERALGEVMMALTPDCDFIIAVGSGSINDLCKYASFVSGREYFILASAPSMDGFASIGAPLIFDNLKTTFDTHTPEVIIGDTDILCRAPMEMITAGLGDILGKYTCLVDWKMAHAITGEYYCPTIVKMVEISIRRVAENSHAVRDRDAQVINNIMEALVLTGIAMSFVGNSRPASGSEHHLSHFWEMRFLMEGKKPVLHGRKVGVGTVVISYLYHQLEQTPVDFDRASRAVKEFDQNRWEEQMRRSFGKAAGGVIALEKKVHKNAPEDSLRRIRTMRENWDALMGIVRDSLPATEQIAAMLEELGAPTAPQGVGVDRGLLTEGILCAKEVRDRFTLLQILWDLGLLENFSERAAARFFGPASAQEDK